ncbi:SDR family NAD(P)-dependent oxidoreductase [Streptomyces malaysiensis]|uniref:SDR family NAD(P)-dependent oxidoreductase n=1 Tax=Streptomyces malaysiensis subsp. samsunensis TaxID=459658 RepID=A0A9X2M6V3_STRMQ|nr:SDR family NAD(P)-dependent oxidoreductase [Streptomyces samsunensis]MCQ8836507.1 SDR family NAD(P)-dependent oxidoreductase [Streptomyces samsunensis]
MAGSGGPVPLVLSARSQEAVRAQSAALYRHLSADEELPLGDVARTLATRRTFFEYRAAVLGGDRKTVMEALGALAEGAQHSDALLGPVPAGGGKVVFSFPGQGAQWPGMAQELLDTSAVFTARVEECAAALAPYTDWSLLDVLRQAPGAPSLERVDVVQPVLFAVMVSLAALWDSHGVRPDAVMGHSQGEIAAACVAGALTLQDAARVVALRSRAIVALRGRGGMVAVPLPAERVAADLESWVDRVGIAAFNGASSTVISGETEALEEILAHYGERQVRAKAIPVDYASHSPQVEEVQEEILDALAPIAPVAPRIPVFSTLTGDWADETAFDANYWYRNLRFPVRFASATRSLAEQGHSLHIECSPHPVLTIGLQETLEEMGATGAAIGTLRRDQGGERRFLLALAEAHISGVPVDWDRAVPAGDAFTDLPTYPFEERRYWLDASSPVTEIAELGLRAAGHPLLGASFELAGTGAAVLTGRLALATQPWMSDHAVFGTVLLPGAALVELAVKLGDQTGCPEVEELTLHAPLVVPEQGSVEIQLVAESAGADGRRSFGVHARRNGDRQPWVRHASGVLAPMNPLKPASDGSWPPAGAKRVELSDPYERLADSGYGYGPTFRALRGLWRNGDELYAELELPPKARDDAPAFAIHPALLDAALHPLGLDHGDEVRLPFSWAGIRLHATGAVAARTTLTPQSEGRVRVELSDPSGAPLLTVDSLAMRDASPVLDEDDRPVADAVLLLDWVPTPAGPDASWAPSAWAVLGEAADSTGSGLPRHRHVRALREAVAQGASAPEVALLPVPFADRQDPEAARDVLAQVLTEIQSWLADPALDRSRLVVITRGAVGARPGEDPHNTPGAAVWGLLRTAQSEHPGRFVLADLDSAVDGPGALAAALGTDEPQLALRDGEILTPRLVRSGEHDRLAPPVGGQSWKLDTIGSGTFENLGLMPSPDADRSLAPGEVRVAVRAAGLNFRDTLIALGMYPGDAALGGEAAGTVVAVGEDVPDLAPGDRVMGLFPTGGVAPVAVTDYRLLARMPHHWSYVQAAGVPVVYLTAYFGLRDLADVGPGESLLIHAVTGGVGMAAVQLARHWGLEVYGTAGPGKWDTARRMGVDGDHLASSRDLAFEERFRAATGGRGVDVVLNSLAREFVDASMRLLADGGRFLEMGKTDIRTPEAITAQYPGAAYHPYDLVRDAGPDRIRSIFAELAPLFDSGVLTPLPATVWETARTAAAFRHLAQARHTGKLVVTLPPALNSGGTVLITGGTGTLGALTARHVVERHGVRHLLLLSRSGECATGSAELVEQLTAAGARVTLGACDVADPEALARALEGIPAEHPLTAVIHTAGALEDGTLETLTPGHFDTVMRGKADAAWHLHRLTQKLDLSAFVVFSSLAGTLGSPGQGNYAAANAYVDALVQHRHRHGLPGTALVWGLWTPSSGMTGAMDRADGRRLAGLGIRPVDAADGLALFDAALADGSAVVVPAEADTAVLQAIDEAAIPPLLRDRVRRRARSAAAPAAPHAGMTGPELRRHLLELVRSHVAAVLGHPTPEAIAVGREFKKLGFDSLTAVELRNRLSGAIGERLPATLIFDHPTPAALAEYLCEQIAPAADVAPDLLAELDRLADLLTTTETDEEIRAAIGDRLNALSRGWGGAPGEPVGTTDDELRAAGDDQLFGVIENELGIS